MFLVNFFELNRPWIFFLTKGKKNSKEKKERFSDPKNKNEKKKNLPAAVNGFLSFFRPVFFFEYFPTFKKIVTVTLLL